MCSVAKFVVVSECFGYDRSNSGLETLSTPSARSRSCRGISLFVRLIEFGNGVHFQAANTLTSD